MLQAKSILYSLVQVWKNFRVTLPHDIGPMIITWNQMPHVIDHRPKKCIHQGWIVREVELEALPRWKSTGEVFKGHSNITKSIYCVIIAFLGDKHVASDL